MAVFHLSVVTPDRIFFDGDAERVIVRTRSGDVGILKGHAKYISAIGIGKLRIKTEEGERTAAVADGFIKAGGEETVILAAACEWEDEIDLERARRAKERAEQLLKSAESEREQELASLKLKRAVNRINLAK